MTGRRHATADLVAATLVACLAVSAGLPTQLAPTARAQTPGAMSGDGASQGAAAARALETARRAYMVGDYDAALALFQPLAEAENPTAQFWLGKMYKMGRGLPRDYRRSVEWLRAAATRGDMDAQNSLALAYRDGLGVERRPVVALAWFTLAAASAHPIPTRNLNELANTLTREQILQGQALARDYHATITADPPAAAPMIPTRPAPSPEPDLAPDPITTNAPTTSPDGNYAVQIGLFRDPTGVRRIQARVASLGLTMTDYVIEINGIPYHRLRVGPYRDDASAQTVKRTIDSTFNIKSMVIHLEK